MVEISFLWAIFHLQHRFTMNSLPVQTIRETSSQNQCTAPKFAEISDQKNIFKIFQKNFKICPKFLDIPKKFSKVPSGEIFQV